MRWLRPLILFGIGGFLYVLIELFTRGRSHWSMFLVGGMAFYLIGCINEYTDGSRSYHHNVIGTDCRDYCEYHIRMECVGL